LLGTKGLVVVAVVYDFLTSSYLILQFGPLMDKIDAWSKKHRELEDTPVKRIPLPLIYTFLGTYVMMLAMC
jgi:hypothetical protein